MSIELYLAFCLATAVLVLMPGPIVTLVIAQTLRYGTAIGLSTVAGSAAGNALLVTVGALGLSTIFILLTDLFEIIRWVGAIYLIWLGIREWCSSGAELNAAEAGVRQAKSSVFWQAIVVAITNPKTILFYAAFFPQFIDIERPLGPQLLIMCVSFVVIGGIFDSCYALMAGRLRGYITGVHRAKIRSRITGGLLVCTGIGLVLARQ